MLKEKGRVSEVKLRAEKWHKAASLLSSYEVLIRMDHACIWQRTSILHPASHCHLGYRRSLKNVITIHFYSWFKENAFTWNHKKQVLIFSCVTLIRLIPFEHLSPKKWRVGSEFWRLEANLIMISSEWRACAWFVICCTGFKRTADSLCILLLTHAAQLN